MEPKTTITRKRTEDCVDPHLNDTWLVGDDNPVNQFVPKRVRFGPYVRVHRRRNYCIIHTHTIWKEPPKVRKYTSEAQCVSPGEGRKISVLYTTLLPIVEQVVYVPHSHQYASKSLNP
jgi:hypothetical protein